MNKDELEKDLEKNPYKIGDYVEIKKGLKKFIGRIGVVTDVEDSFMGAFTGKIEKPYVEVAFYNDNTDPNIEDVKLFTNFKYGVQWDDGDDPLEWFPSLAKAKEFAQKRAKDRDNIAVQLITASKVQRIK